MPGKDPADNTGTQPANTNDGTPEQNPNQSVQPPGSGQHPGTEQSTEQLPNDPAGTHPGPARPEAAPQMGGPGQSGDLGQHNPSRRPGDAGERPGTQTPASINSGGQGVTPKKPQGPPQMPPGGNSVSGGDAPGEGAASAGGDAVKDAAGQGAKQAAASQVPGGQYADAISAQGLKDAHAQGGTSGAAEELGAQAGDVGAQALADYFSGGQASSSGVNKYVGKAGREIGKGVGKFALRWVQAHAGFLAIVLMALGGMVMTIAAVSGDDRLYPPPPTQEQCDTMPVGWCEVVYNAQKATHNKPVPVPWTVLAAMARVNTDFGNTSPYDDELRFPDREVPPWLAENFPVNEVLSSSGGGHVPYQSGSLAWGGHKNGRIPESELDTVPWDSSVWAEKTTIAALKELNEAYKKDHGGKNIAIVSAYRSYDRQVQVRADWCNRGACSNAAKPGTSNHGWGKAIDFRNFGGLKQYSHPNFKWMQKNGPRFGFHHPPNMGPNGRGPYEPWHWEYRGVVSEDSDAPATAAGMGVSAGTAAAACEAAGPQLPIGGKGNEGAGPFLASVSMQERHPRADWQDPCSAAHAIALEMAEAAFELESDGLEGRGDVEEAGDFWKTVIRHSGVVTSPSMGEKCTNVPEDVDDVDALIDLLWSCELQNAEELHVVADVTRHENGRAQYNTFSRADAEAMLLSEARSVAWEFSNFGKEVCKEAREGPQGVFPLTAQDMADVGLVQRCDPVENIQAAAKIVVKAESVPVDERTIPETAGTYWPMIGGWAELSKVMGGERDLFSHVGPRQTWVADRKCTSAVYDYLVDTVEKEEVFAELAFDTRVRGAGKFKKALKMWPTKVVKACDGSAADVALVGAKELEKFWETELGIVPSEIGEAFENPEDFFAGDLSPEQYDELFDDKGQWAEVIEESEKIKEALGEDAADKANLYQRAQGLVTWLGYRANELKEEVDELKDHSMIQRLTTTSFTNSTPPRVSDPIIPVDTWLDTIVEWAIFYGGIARPFDTHGERTGSLKLSLSGDGALYGGATVEGKVKLVLDTARKYLGVDYTLGAGNADGPTMVRINGKKVPAFDCSAFTAHAFASAGYSIGRTTADQQHVGEAVASIAEAKPGDLVFFGSPRVSHVAIYLGDDRIIHAPRTGDVVKIASVYETPSKIRRVITEQSRDGGVDAWVNQALDVLYSNGFPKGANDAKHLKTIIHYESSGNPDAVNNWDSNAKKGTPSFGLMQTIQPTFDAYALPGYKNRDDPVAQIIAGARYAQSRYKGLANVPGVKSVARGEPYVGY